MSRYIFFYVITTLFCMQLSYAGDTPISDNDIEEVNKYIDSSLHQIYKRRRIEESCAGKSLVNNQSQEQQLPFSASTDVSATDSSRLSAEPAMEEGEGQKNASQRKRKRTDHTTHYHLFDDEVSQLDDNEIVKLFVNNHQKISAPYFKTVPSIVCKCYRQRVCDGDKTTSWPNKFFTVFSRWREKLVEMNKNSVLVDEKTIALFDDFVSKVRANTVRIIKKSSSTNTSSDTPITDQDIMMAANESSESRVLVGNNDQPAKGSALEKLLLLISKSDEEIIKYFTRDQKIVANEADTTVRKLGIALKRIFMTGDGKTVPWPNKYFKILKQWETQVHGYMKNDVLLNDEAIASFDRFYTAARSKFLQLLRSGLQKYGSI